MYKSEYGELGEPSRKLFGNRSEDRAVRAKRQLFLLQSTRGPPCDLRTNSYFLSITISSTPTTLKT